MTHRYLAIAWFLMLLVWVLASLGSKETAARQDARQRILHLAVLGISFYLLFNQSFAADWLDRSVLPTSMLFKNVVGWFLVVLGFGFAIWARLVLGRNWSAEVTIKADHTLLISGPYGIVRHPIYTGILTAMLGTAVVLDQVHCYLALPLAFIAWAAKSRVEEQFMQQQFGAEYTRYRARVKGLVPLIW